MPASWLTISGDVHEARARDVAEEVGFPVGAGGIDVRRLPLDLPEDGAQRLAEGDLAILEARMVEIGFAGLFQLIQFGEELLQPEVPFQYRKQKRGVPAGSERPVEQRETRADLGFLLGNRGGNVIVGAGVRDAAAENLTILIHEHCLGGGGSQIDSDEGTHEAISPTLWL